MKKGHLIGLVALLLALALCLLSCGSAAVSVTGVSINEKGELIVVMSDGSTQNMGKVTGGDGTTGEQGIAGPAGEKGEAGTKVEIGANGNWYLDGEDSGVSASGAQGDSGKAGTKVEIGANGNWYLDGEDSGVSATGATGAPGEAGTILSIGANGNWFLDGEDSGVPADGGEGASSLTLATAVTAVKNAVVEILTASSSSYGNLTAGAGSGVIIKSNGTIITNHHVIDGADTIYVRLANGNVYEAELVGSDNENDIAVIKIEANETLTVATLGNSAGVSLGQTVFAIGNPLGELGGTVTSGIISTLEREVQVDGITMKLLQTDTAINAGNSGGGLFNLQGELIGVVNAKYAAAGVEGLGFAIPINTAKASADLLIEHGYIPGRPSLGVSLADAYFTYNVLRPYVAEVNVNNSALQVGDYIYSVNGTTVSLVSEVRAIIRQCEIGDGVSLRIWRGNGWITCTETLVEYTGW